jgi:homocitrate synthase NifV
MKQRRYLLDSTLRDGEQMPGLCFTPRQKLRIASLLDSSGVHQIEAGVPASSNQEKENITKILENRTNAGISVWARLVPSDIEHSIDVRPDMIHVSVPVADRHIFEKLRKDKDWVISQLKTCLRLIEKSGIPFSAGFEDAFRSDIVFMKTVCGILSGAGVKRIRLADTVGVASPTQCRTVLNSLYAELNGKVEFGIHAHNDFGMAIANTIEAAKACCTYADVTAGGIGERAGNCDLMRLVQASSSIFDWGITPAAARRLQEKINKIIQVKSFVKNKSN